MQVVDVKGPTVLQMIKHMRSVENQAEFSHNSDYVPESLGKVLPAVIFLRRFSTMDTL
jgi:hypothetical protein